MKKFLVGLTLIASCVLFGSSFPVMAGMEGEGSLVTVKVANSELEFDQPPIIVEGRTLVPFRAIFEALGANVEWNAENREVIGTRGDNIIKMSIDNPVIEINGERVTLDVPAQIVNSRTMVPIRAISDGLDETVKWNPNTKTVEITTSFLEKGDISSITVNPNWLEEAGIRAAKGTMEGDAVTFATQAFNYDPVTGEITYLDVTSINSSIDSLVTGDEAKNIAVNQGIIDTDKLESKVYDTFGGFEWVAIDAIVVNIEGDYDYGTTWNNTYNDADIDLRAIDNKFDDVLYGDAATFEKYRLLYNNEYYNIVYSKKNMFSEEDGRMHTTSVFCFPKGYDNMLFIHTGTFEGKNSAKDIAAILAEKVPANFANDKGLVLMPLKEEE